MGLIDILINNRQDRRIDELREQAAEAARDHARSDALRDQRDSASTEQLWTAIGQLEERVDMLTRALVVSLEMLAEVKALDGDALTDRVTAALRAPSAAPSQTRADHVACTNCKRSVARTSTTITSNAVLCDRCASAASL